MEKFAWLMSLALLAGCAGAVVQPGRHAGAYAEAGVAASEACKSALALRTGANAVSVLPISHTRYGQGQEVFLSLYQTQWRCTTDARGNINHLARH